MPKSRSRRRPASPPRRRPARPPLVPQPAPGLRGRVERRSAPALVWLSSRPKALLPLLTAALLIGGLASPTPVGVPLLVLLAALVGWLTYLSWPAVEGTARLLRLGLVGLVLAAVLGRLTA